MRLKPDHPPPPTSFLSYPYFMRMPVSHEMFLAIYRVVSAGVGAVVGWSRNLTVELCLHACLFLYI